MDRTVHLQSKVKGYPDYIIINIVVTTERVEVMVVVWTALSCRGSGSGLVPAQPPIPGHVAREP